MKRLMLLSLATAVSLSVAAQETQPVPADIRSKDRSAIRETMTSFTAAFKARDARKVAAHWTSEGEHQTTRGLTLRGHDELQKAFATFFEATPEVEAELQPENLRFLSAHSAIEQGIATVRKGGLPSRAHYEALLVREGETWRLAILSESPDTSVSVSELEWLIGDWKSTGGGDAEIQASYAWDASKKFIHSQFSITEAKRTRSSRQVIGIDPETGSLHSWTFEASGAVGVADWNRDGDHWVLKTTSQPPQGGPQTETNLLRRTSASTFTWQSTNRRSPGSEIEDLAPVKVTRVPATK